ncbi:hypothetical protein ACKKBG_A14550 [Auxenochlorella protothecoides x Auxenochlorella symbiontica]
MLARLLHVCRPALIRSPLPWNPSHPSPMPPRRGRKATASADAKNAPHNMATSDTPKRPEPEPEEAPVRTTTKKARKPRSPSPPPPPLYDVSMRAPALPSTAAAATILCWNVAGLRGLLKKDPTAIASLIAREQPHVLCLQEIKLQTSHCDEELHDLLALGPEWQITWNCSTAKKGYSGTAILTRIPPLSTVCGMGSPGHDEEGRVLAAEFDTFYLVTVYVPNSGEGLKRLEYRVGSWDEAFSSFIKKLEARKPVVVCGDLNCARQSIDIHSPKTNLRSAGFTQEERDSFQQRYMDAGWVDAFRTRYPEHTGYTYWSYRFNLRARNKGWRLDYFLVSGSLWPSVYDVFHLHDVMGSDHCPLGLTVRLDEGKGE